METGIGPRLRAARHRAGLNREALAVRAGVSWSAIAQIESGRRANVRPKTLSALADALEVTIDYLVSGSVPCRPMLDHRALLYATEAEFLDFATPFVEEAAERSEPTFVVARADRVRRLRRELGGAAKAVEFAERDAFYTTPGEVLARFRDFLERSTTAGAPWARALGEPVWSGRADHDVRHWVRFEALLNLAFSASPFTAVCSYNTDEVSPAVIENARATHPHTVEHTELLVSANYLDPGGLVLDGP